MSFAWKFAFWFGSWISIIVVGYFSPRLIYFPLLNIIFLLGGILLIFYGLLLNAIGGRTLKKYGHFEIGKGIKKPEKLVEEGIYSCMRHPVQFGSIFFGWGIAFLTTKIIAILYTGWLSFLSLYFIMEIEERETINEFGEKYCEFMRERKVFTFSYSCLRRGFEALKKK